MHAGWEAGVAWRRPVSTGERRSGREDAIGIWQQRAASGSRERSELAEMKRERRRAAAEERERESERKLAAATHRRAHGNGARRGPAARDSETERSVHSTVLSTEGETPRSEVHVQYSYSLQYTT